MNEKLTIYHGSEHIIDLPMYKSGKSYNDYGRGFYCTKEIEMAKEWACKNNKNGFVNKYEQKINDIDKAQVHTVYKLARAMRCNVEDLLENPMNIV